MLKSVHFFHILLRVMGDFVPHFRHHVNPVRRKNLGTMMYQTVEASFRIKKLHY